MTKQNNNITNTIHKHKRGKPWFITLSVIALIFGAVQYVLYYFAFPLLKEKICESVHTKSNGLYTMNFDNIKINLVGKGIELVNFSLTSDTTVYYKLRDSINYNKAIYNISVDNLKIKNISITALLRDRLWINKIELVNPTIRLTAKPYSNKEQKKYDAFHKDLYPIISQWFKSLQINYIECYDGYFDFHTKVENKQGIQVAKIDIFLNNLYLDEKVYKEKNKLFYSDNIILNSGNYVIKLADSLHTIRANKLMIDTRDSVIRASEVSLLADGKLKWKSSYNKFNVKLEKIYISGLDINNAYFNKRVNLKNVVISKPEIKFIRGGNINRKTKNFEQNNGDWFNLIKGTLNLLAVDSLKIENAKIKFAKASQPDKNLYNAGDINIMMQGFLLDSLSFMDYDKILYSNNIEINLSDYQMLLPDNRHKLTAENLFVSTENKTVKAEKIKIKPTYKTIDSTAKEINISVPKLEINNIDITKAYNFKDYRIGQVKITVPEIKTKSFIDSTQIANNNPNKSSWANIFNNEFINSIKINNVGIYQGKLNITSKASIKEDSLTLFGKLSMNLGNFTMNKATISSGDILPFTTTNIDLNLNDVVIKMPKNFHTLRLENLNINSRKDRVYIKNMKYAYEIDSSHIAIMKRLNKSSLLDISLYQAEFSKTNLLNAIFKQKVEISKLSIKKPHININLFPQLKHYNDSIKSKTDTLETEIAKNNIQENSLYNLYTDFDKIIVDALPQNLKLIKLDTLITDSSRLTFSFKDTLNNKIVSTTSNFRFVVHNFYYNQDSISTEKKFMLAKDYDLNINNFVFLLPDRIHKVETNNIKLSTENKYLKLKTIFVNSVKRSRIPQNKILNAYLPEINITNIDFKKFGETGIFEADSIIMNNAVGIFAKAEHPIEIDSTILATINKNKKKKVQIKGFNIGNFVSFGNHFQMAKGDESDMFRNMVSNMNIDLSCKNLTLDSSNITEKGHLIDWKQPYFNIDSFYVNLKDSNKLEIGNIHQENDSLQISQTYFGAPDNYKKNHFSIPKMTLTDVDYMEFAFNKRFVAQAIKIHDPYLETFPNPNKKKQQKDSTSNKLHFDVIVDTVKIDGIAVDINRINKPVFPLYNMDATILGINTEEIHEKDFPCESIVLGATNYSIYIQDSLYRFNFGRAELNPETRIATVKGFDFRPKYGRYDFYNHFPYSKAATYIYCDSVKATRFNWPYLIKTKTMDMDSMYIYNASFASYLNTSKPNDTAQTQPNLQGWLNRMKLKMHVNNTVIDNGFLEIEQLNPKASVSGVLTFTDMNGTIKNFTNDSVFINKNDTILFSAKGKLMNRSDVNANILYRMKSPTDTFRCEFTVDSLYLPVVNPFLENALFAKIEEGTLHQANIKFTSDNVQSTGISRFVYSDLKLTVNKADSIQPKKRGLISLLANLFVKHNNTKKFGYIYAEPDRSRSFVSYWLSSALSGAKATVGFESKLQKYERKQKLTARIRERFAHRKEKKEIRKKK
ncbi:MAG: hypothetical protein IKQ46_09175 [Bacteroidales bacterium]|nr:hypothetical protein [Bacteroidales bacterium]